MTGDLNKVAIETLFTLPNGRRFWAEVTTDTSMAPAYLSGDAVLVERCLIGQLKIGDHAVFVQKNRLAIHPVIKKQPKTVITKGINNDKLDPPLTEKALLGKALKRRRPLINKVKNLIYSANQFFLF